MNSIWMNAIRAAAGAGGDFSPDQISDMVFDHNVHLIPGNDGDTIASHTFNSIEFSEATAGKRPELKKGVNGINGYSTLRFNGAHAWRTTSAIDLTGTNGITCFVVANITGEATTRVFYEFGTSAAIAGSFSFNADSTNKPAWTCRGSTGNSTLVYATSQVDAPLLYTQVSDMSLSTNETMGYVKGVSDGTRPNNSNNSTNFGNNVFYVAARTESSLYATMDIARIILYDRALTTEERQQVEFYLADMYGLGFMVQVTELADNAYPATTTASNLTYVRSSPGARAVYSTGAEAITVHSYNDVYGAFPAWTHIGVRINGADFATLAPGAAGHNTNTLSIGSGTKIIEMINGLQTEPSGTVLGTWVRAIESDVPINAVAQPSSPRIVAYGDSLSVGANSTYPATEGVWQLVRSVYNGSLIIEGWGYRSLHDDCNTSGLRAAFVSHLAALSPDIIWLAIGTNDYGLNKWSAASFGTAYAALLDDLHTALPSCIIYCQTPIERTTETANGSGSTLGDYRTQITTASDARSGYCVTVDGTAAGYPQAPGDLADGVHPSTAGHAMYAAAVLSELGL